MRLRERFTGDLLFTEVAFIIVAGDKGKYRFCKNRRALSQSVKAMY